MASLHDTRLIHKSQLLFLSTAFLYNSKKQLEFEIKKHKSSYISIKNEILRYKPKKKHVQNLHKENYKSLIKEIKEIQINGEIVHVHE